MSINPPYEPKSNLIPIPEKVWVTPEELAGLIRFINAACITDKWTSMSIVAERADGQVFFHGTKCNNRYERAGYFMRMAMDLLADKSHE